MGSGKELSNEERAKIDVLLRIHPECRRTVNRVLTNDPNTQWTKRNKPPLTAVHREARLSFASKHLTDSTDWSTVIFSDEKKFNLDDPDGFAYFGTISFREHLVPLFSVAWLLSVVMLMPLVTRHLKRTFSPRGTMHLWPDLDWFRANGMSVIDWPARCPDLNPIENLWGCLAREVYKNSRQVENISELDSEIQFAW
ncbi:hypothetical protein B4U79_07644, partial [Dinothrombium tinctorium]